MLIHLLKWIHLLCVLGLLGTVLYCLLLTTSKKFTRANTRLQHRLERTYRYLLRMGLVALVTGSLLIYPKHFTLHTPWIQAAYIYMLVFGASVVALLKYRDTLFTLRGRSVAAYACLMALMVVVIHDAVTKTTFLFGT